MSAISQTISPSPTIKIEIHYYPSEDRIEVRTTEKDANGDWKYRGSERRFCSLSFSNTQFLELKQALAQTDDFCARIEKLALLR
jgi:hypothetical protein